MRLSRRIGSFAARKGVFARDGSAESSTADVLATARKLLGSSSCSSSRRVQGRPAVLPRAQEERLFQALLTLVLCVASLATTVVAAKAMGYDSGTAAGLMAGAFTESTVIGTAALRAIQDEAGSKVPVLGYTVPYAIGNILLTAWGPVVVMLTR